MNVIIRNAGPVVLAIVCSLSLVHGAHAFKSSSSYDAQTYHRRPVTLHQYLSDHPKVRAATVGSGVGAAAGAVTGLVTGRGVLRGAVLGAGTGAGVGLVRSSQVMGRHPIVNDVATGSVIGLGLGLTGGRNHGTATRTTAVGALVGLGAGLLIHGL